MIRKQYKTFSIIECSPQEFKILYWDKPKTTTTLPHCFSGGFFAPYAETINGKKIYFTLPVANLRADAGANVPIVAQKYINEWTRNKGLLNGKVTMSCNENGNKHFANKKVSTLLVYNNNNIQITDTFSLPADIKYAISGVPCIKNSQDVDWKKYVLPQGWGTDVTRATYRNWIAIKKNVIYIISGRSTTPNYIYGMEFFKTMQPFAFQDCIGLDGGGSYFFNSLRWKKMATAGYRDINNIGMIG